eukprot:EG_transcript_7346
MSLSRVEPLLRPKISGYRAWNALVTLWTHAEEQWVKWGCRPITLQDILSRKGGHHLEYTELDPAPVCDWCSINYAVYACPSDLLQMECLEQRFACEECYEMGFNFHKSVLGDGDSEYLISSISSAFSKADESHVGALNFLEALYWLWLLLEGVSDSYVAYLKAHGFGVEALKLLWDFYDDNTTEEGGLRVSDLRRMFKELFRISPVNLGVVYDIHVPPGQLAKFRHVLWITYSVARPGSPYVKQWTRNEKMLLRMSTVEIRQDPSYSEAEDMEAPLCSVPTFLKARCSILKMLGEGGCNVVWLVEYEGVRMAAKVPKASISTDAKDQMFAAARTQALIQHRNVLRVLGVHQEAAWPCILLELAEGGDLSDWHLASRIDRCVQWKALLEVAQGMAALHSITPPVIHRDLKGQNVFLTRYGTAKVADFDFAVRATPPHNTALGTCGTPGYIAPEVFSNREYGVEVDVYSFGSLAYEVTHRAFPFAVETQHRSPEQWYERAARLTLEGSRPAMNEEGVCPKMVQLIRDCWQQEAHARPT